MKEEIGKYVITGGPGVGKTATILALAKRGFSIGEEAARKVIEKELEKTKGIVTWKNVGKRQEKILSLQLRLEKKAEEKARKAKGKKKNIFFDRGIPDGIAYFKIAKEKIPKKLLEESKKSKRHYKKVFFLEPVPYKKDNVRKEPQKIAKKIHKLIFQTYKRLGYEIVRVPLMSVLERAKFIERAIKNGD